MLKLINLALRTEFSFKQTFQHTSQILDGQDVAVGIADINGTYGFVQLEQLTKEKSIKPIYGIRLMVVENVNLRPRGQQGNYGPYYVFLAKNPEGVKEIYNLVKKAYENFYFRPTIGWTDLFQISNNVIVIANNFETCERIDYIGVNYMTPNKILKHKLPKVFINDNEYPTTNMRNVYQLLCGSQKRGNGYQYKFESHTYPSHILSTEEFLLMHNDISCVENSHIIADQIDRFELPKAEMVRYSGQKNLKLWCKTGAKKRGIDLSDEIYGTRLNKELALIEEKNFGDYFLNVADMTEYAKKHMLVGPSRGSSAGSLVCYLIGITEIDPIKYGLIFERFIDINRLDIPDIDIDFPDTKRSKVIKYMERAHGKNNVSQIANISRFKPKSAIGDFSTGLSIPKYEAEQVKGAIIERSGGDARAKMCIEDTLESTEIGKEFIKKYPSMKLTKYIENHASHTSTHAAGIIISNDDITNYCGINTRDNCIMSEKKGAEYLGLLKIDILGLRTLAILEDCAELAGFDPKIFYIMPTDDENTYKIFNEMRLQGVFQFEGHALQFITRQIGVHEFNDIVAITSLARPGAMNSGGASRYVKYKLGKETPIYRSDIHKKITEESMGIVIYQEQMMMMAKEIGNMTWEDVSTLRKAASKSLGDEFFSKFKDKFVDGAINANGYSESDAEALWHDISATGSWTFNKSHAVSYGLISYWTAWCKANYPLEFAAANLNNSKNPDSAIRLLRDFVIHDNIEYTAIDPDRSDVNWSIHDGKLLGGLTSIDGIGIKKAQDIIKKRESGSGYTQSIVSKLIHPSTPFVDIFPCRTKYGKLYDNPMKYGISTEVSKIEDVIDEGEYTIIGKLKDIDLRDRNDYQSVFKRNGELVTENQFYLKMFIEDDTDSIMVMIPPYKFDDLNGRRYAEHSKVDHTWFLLRGEVRSGWRMLSISAIFDLTEWRPE